MQAGNFETHLLVPIHDRDGRQDFRSGGLTGNTEHRKHVLDWTSTRVLLGRAIGGHTPGRDRTSADTVFMPRGQPNDFSGLRLLNQGGLITARNLTT